MAIQSVPQVPNNSNPTPIPQTFQTKIDSAILALNEEIVFVRKTLEIAELESPPGDFTLKFMSPNSFKTAGYANRFILWKGKRRYIAPEWLKSPLRRTVNRTVYEPGQPRITSDNNLNTWFPSPIKPIKGDISLFLRYLDHIFKSDPTFRDWVLAWAACPLQHPGAKLNQAVVFWSAEQGTGKSTFAYILKHIYGLHNVSTIREADFNAAYNGWAVGKQLVEVDELPEGQRARARSDYLKTLTTRMTIPVDLKYQNRYEIRDTINYFYTSNHIESLYLEAHDRRHYIHHLPEEKYSEWSQLEPWLHSGGFEAIRHYLEFEIDLSKPIAGGNPLDPSDLKPFSPTSDAPRTAARAEVIRAGFDDVETWIREMLSSPLTYIGDELESRSLWTSDELYAIFHAKYPEVKCGPKKFSQDLNKQIKPVNEAKQIRLGRERLRMYFVTDRTRILTLSQIKEILSRERGENCDSESD